jgi:hypothetical protein
MRIALMITALMVFSSMAFSSNAGAACYRDAWGRVVCGNGQAAGGYNPHTGTAWKSTRNQYGVATTQTSRGGEAKTKNGKGVYRGPNGTNCYKTAYSHGCN